MTTSEPTDQKKKKKKLPQDWRLYFYKVKQKMQLKFRKHQRLTKLQV